MNQTGQRSGFIISGLWPRAAVPGRNSFAFQAFAHAWAQALSFRNKLASK
jgi:hypothetical protein